MKITLLKNHYHNGHFYEAGHELDCDKETFDFIQKVNMEDRKALVAKEAEAAKVIAALKTPIFQEQPQPTEIPGLGTAKPQEKNLAEASALQGNKGAK